MKNIFLLVVAVLLLGVVLSCSQAEPKKILVLVKEPAAKAPVQARIFFTSKDAEQALKKDRPAKYRINPEEEFAIGHQIKNGGSESRVVELVLTIVMDFHGAIEWKIRPFSSEPQYPFAPNPQGPAHLFLPEGGTDYIVVVLTLPEGYRGTSVSVFLNVNETNCTEIENCPWG